MKKYSPSYARMRVWRHNSYRGQTHMALVNLLNMQQSDTLTADAKRTISLTVPLLQKLLTDLQTREDPK